MVRIGGNGIGYIIMLYVVLIRYDNVILFFYYSLGYFLFFVCSSSWDFENQPGLFSRSMTNFINQHEIF